MAAGGSGWLIDGRRRAPKPMPCASGGGGSNITRMCLLPQKTTQTTSSPPSRKPSIWARKQGRAPLVARVRHSLQRPRLQPCHAPLIGGGPRSSSDNLAKFTANRRASSCVSRFGRRAVQRSVSSTRRALSLLAQSGHIERSTTKFSSILKYQPFRIVAEITIDTRRFASSFRTVE
jgi:hypothetical protein